VFNSATARMTEQKGREEKRRGEVRREGSSGIITLAL
jgi:hypothetical protein